MDYCIYADCDLSVVDMDGLKSFLESCFEVSDETIEDLVACGHYPSETGAVLEMLEEYFSFVGDTEAGEVYIGVPEGGSPEEGVNVAARWYLWDFEEEFAALAPYLSGCVDLSNSFDRSRWRYLFFEGQCEKEVFTGEWHKEAVCAGGER